MRLFIAIDLDDSARAAVAAEQKRIAAALGDSRSAVKWVKPDHMHMTLVFLGEIEETGVSPIIEAMKRVVDTPPFEMVLENVGVFPPHGAPRVVWNGVTGGARQATDLQSAIAHRVAALGIDLESRPFRPHLTLGRWRTSRSADRRTVVASARPGVIARVRVDHATLYHSRPSSAGPSYTPLARATLTGGVRHQTIGDN